MTDRYAGLRGNKLLETLADNIEHRRAIPADAIARAVNVAVTGRIVHGFIQVTRLATMIALLPQSA